jgi:hypothetical protein
MSRIRPICYSERDICAGFGCHPRFSCRCEKRDRICQDHIPIGDFKSSRDAPPVGPSHETPSKPRRETAPDLPSISRSPRSREAQTLIFQAASPARASSARQRLDAFQNTQGLRFSRPPMKGEGGGGGSGATSFSDIAGSPNRSASIGCFPCVLAEILRTRVFVSLDPLILYTNR